MADIRDRLGRAPVIWDNSCVNDSRLLSPFLPLDPSWPVLGAGAAAGRMVNPINQPFLAQLTLARLQTPTDFRAVADRWAGAVLAALLAEDLPLFTRTGREGLTPDAADRLHTRYAAHRDTPMGREVLDWLAGAYVFDPACLT